MVRNNTHKKAAATVYETVMPTFTANTFLEASWYLPTAISSSSSSLLTWDSDSSC